MQQEVKQRVLPEGRVLNHQGKVVFAKGMKGGPGRPKGTYNKMKDLAQALMGENAKNIVKKIIQKALTDGDKLQGECLKMCIDRILPPQRHIDIKGSQET